MQLSLVKSRRGAACMEQRRICIPLPVPIWFQVVPGGGVTWTFGNEYPCCLESIWRCVFPCQKSITRDLLAHVITPLHLIRLLNIFPFARGNQYSSSTSFVCTQLYPYILRFYLFCDLIFSYRCLLIKYTTEPLLYAL